MKKCHPAGSNMAGEPSSSSLYPMDSLHMPITVVLPAVAVTTAIHQTLKHWCSDFFLFCDTLYQHKFLLIGLVAFHLHLWTYSVKYTCCNFYSDFFLHCSYQHEFYWTGAYSLPFTFMNLLCVVKDVQQVVIWLLLCGCWSSDLQIGS